MKLGPHTFFKIFASAYVSRCNRFVRDKLTGHICHVKVINLLATIKLGVILLFVCGNFNDALCILAMPSAFRVCSLVKT